MASQPQPVLPEPNDPKFIDLIRKITEKTLANKIRWQMSQTGVSATVPGGIQLGFVKSRGLLGNTWALFTIRSENENEILRVDNTPLNPFAALSGAAEEQPVRKAVGKLYAAIEGSSRAEVERVIELIDRI